MDFQRETIFDVIEEVGPLLDAHYRELAKNQDRVKLDPDWRRYTEMERQNALLLFTARKDSRLVGYAAFFACPHPHYREMTLVSNDVLFLDAEHRTGRTGVRLIHFCEEQIRALCNGQTCITWHAKEGSVFASILPRLAYQVQDIIFSKLL